MAWIERHVPLLLAGLAVICVAGALYDTSHGRLVEAGLVFLTFALSAVAIIVRVCRSEP